MDIRMMNFVWNITFNYCKKLWKLLNGSYEKCIYRKDSKEWLKLEITHISLLVVPQPDECPYLQVEK